MAMIVLAAVCINCTQYVDYSPDPEKDIGLWIENFANQRSFSYSYSMKTPSVYTEARGECLIGVGECVSGIWRGNDQVMNFEYFGLYDIEYEKQDGKWREAVRGEQTEILTQIERVLEFDKFEYLPDLEKYSYYFKANAAFLSPVHRKEMVGEIKFSSGDYRPIRIWAGLPDSSVYWTIDIYDYNRLKSIKPPVMKWHKYAIRTATGYNSLKKRLDLLEVPYRISRNYEKAQIDLPGYISRDEVQRYFDQPELTVSSIVDDRSKAIRILELNKKTEIYVGDTLFVNSDIKNCRLKFDPIARPYLIILLRKSKGITSRILVEIDDEPPQILNIDKSGKMSKIKLYFNKTFHDMRILRAQLLQPLHDISVEF